MSGFDNSAVCTTSNNDAKLHRFETRLITAPNPKSIGFISYDTNKDQQKQNKKLTNYFFYSKHDKYSYNYNNHNKKVPI